MNFIVSFIIVPRSIETNVYFVRLLIKLSTNNRERRTESTSEEELLFERISRVIIKMTVSSVRDVLLKTVRIMVSILYQDCTRRKGKKKDNTELNEESKMKYTIRYKAEL